MVRCTLAVLMAAVATMQFGCLVPILSLPLNAPGYGHTYRIVDQEDRPVQTGLVLLRSEFHICSTESRIGCYPIKDGVAQVPRRVLQSRWWWPLYPLPPFVTFFGWQNPDVTQVSVLSPGMGRVDCELNGLGPPPTEIRMYPVDAASEGKMLSRLYLWGVGSPEGGSHKEPCDTVIAYVRQRASAIGALPVTSVREYLWTLGWPARLVYGGAMGEHTVKRMRDQFVYLDDDSMWHVPRRYRPLGESWECAPVELGERREAEASDYPRELHNLVTGEVIPVQFRGSWD